MIFLRYTVAQHRAVVVKSLLHLQSIIEAEGLAKSIPFASRRHAMQKPHILQCDARGGLQMWHVVQYLRFTNSSYSHHTFLKVVLHILH